MDKENMINSMGMEENNIKNAKKKKINRKNSRENRESPKTTIKTFFKEECKKDKDTSTPSSAKK